MANLGQDLRQAVRSLLKAKGFAAAAILVMALGIGANTAIFSVVNSVLLRPLPFAEPERLVQVWHVPPPKAFPGMTRFSVSAANYLDWKAMNHVFQNMAIYGFAGYNLTGVDKPQAVTSGSVPESFFPTLGVQPILGRTFSAEEDQPGKNHVVILTHKFWMDHYAGDKNIIGRQIEFDREPYQIVGVMGPNVTKPSWAQVWTPMAMTSQGKTVRGNHNYLVIARLNPGVTLQQANAELGTISQALAQQYPADDKDWGAKAVSLREETVGEVRRPLIVLLCAVIFVLLIACANVANLLLARTLGKRHELAIRVALGASRTRLLQQVLCESVVLSLMGGALGLVVAKFGIALIVKFLSNSLPRSTEIGLDASVLLFTLITSVVTGVVAGLIPAWKYANADAGEGLKDSARNVGADSGGSRTRSALVIAEVALSLMLLVGAGLMMRTLWNLQHENAGFDTQHSLTMVLGFSKSGYATQVSQSQAMEQILGNVRALPGVQAAGMIDDLPLAGGSHQPIQAEGQPVVQMSEQPEVDVRAITPGYVKSMAIPLLKGRDINDGDTMERPGAILISASMAKQIWPNQEAIGKHLTLTFGQGKVMEVVGVVGDVKQDSMTSNEPSPTLYQPIAQREWPKGQEWKAQPFSMVVRAASDPAAITASVINAVHQVDSQMPTLDVMTMDAFIGETLQAQRMNMTLLVAFAALALTLAAVGIYSVLAYAVKRRVREIGIRLALGAQLGDILKLILLQGLKPAAVGVVIGVALSLAMGRAVATMVYGVSATDVSTLAGGSMLLLVVAATASLVPAYRATKVDPASTLRQE
ncbi:MAG: efflux pump, inner rane subunit [Acidobacteriales bacterium]|nr:efflux pump, inner rane subunit [Terriglobales bacterium]